MADNQEIAKEIKTSSRTGLFQRMASYFGFSIKPEELSKDKDKRSAEFNLIATQAKDAFVNKKQSEALEVIERLSGGKLSDAIQDLFESWMNDTQNTYANIEEREDRLNALLYMHDNNTDIEAAVRLLCNEVAMLSDNIAFTVLSEDQDWDDETNYLLDNVWKLDEDLVWALAFDIILFGEAFLGNETSSAGITSVEILKPNTVVEKLEFKPIEVANFKAQMQANGGSTGFTANLATMANNYNATNTSFTFAKKAQIYSSKDNLLKNYVENIADCAANEFFKSHLLGYRMPNDLMVAPWQIQHFMMGEHSSEFYPYGRPMLLSCLAAFRQAQRAAGLEDLRKMLSLPITMWKVKTGGETPLRALDTVTTVKERIENVGLTQEASGMEGPSLISNIWTSDDLVTVERQLGDGGTDEGTVNEQKYLDSKITACTLVPRAYIDPNADGFQMSGKALSQLFAPFRSMVETIRKIIRNGIMDEIETHYAIQNREVPDYVLTLNVINPMADEDMGTKLSSADEVMDRVAALLGVGEKESLPKSVKKDILTKYGNLSPEELSKWEDTYEEEGKDEDAEEVDQEAVDSGFGSDDATGFGMSGPAGGEDEGSEDMGGEDTFEESVLNKKALNKRKQKLIEERYKAYSKEDMRYLLTESLGQLKTFTSSSYFCPAGRRRTARQEESIAFINSVNGGSSKKGKKKLNS